MFCKEDALKDFENFTEKHLCWRPAILLERNFNIAKFLRVPVQKKICEWLLLYIWNANFKQCNLHTSRKLSILEFQSIFLPLQLCKFSSTKFIFAIESFSLKMYIGSVKTYYFYMFVCFAFMFAHMYVFIGYQTCTS